MSPAAALSLRTCSIFLVSARFVPPPKGWTPFAWRPLETETAWPNRRAASTASCT
jgi:hypothetical protein